VEGVPEAGVLPHAVQEWSLTTVAATLDPPAARQIKVKKYGATRFFTEGTILKLTSGPNLTFPSR